MKSLKNSTVLLKNFQFKLTLKFEDKLCILQLIVYYFFNKASVAASQIERKAMNNIKSFLANKLEEDDWSEIGDCIHLLSELNEKFN